MADKLTISRKSNGNTQNQNALEKFKRLSDKFPTKRYIICFVQKVLVGGGAPRTNTSFYSANLCIIIGAFVIELKS